MLWCLLAGTSATAQDITLDTIKMFDRGLIQINSRIELKGDAKRAFGNFKKGAQFFGAMYVSADGTSANWYRNTLTITDARTAAKISCEIDTGAPCVLYASIVPDVSDTEQGFYVPLSREMSDGWPDFKKRGDVGKYKAVAISRIGAFGVSWGYPQPDQAVERAMMQCLLSMHNRMQNVFSGRVQAFIDADLLTCRPLIVYQQN